MCADEGCKKLIIDTDLLLCDAPGCNLAVSSLAVYHFTVTNLLNGGVILKKKVLGNQKMALNMQTSTITHGLFVSLGTSVLLDDSY